MSPELQILLTAVVTAVAAALPGTSLVLRRTALVSEAISRELPNARYIHQPDSTHFGPLVDPAGTAALIAKLVS